MFHQRKQNYYIVLDFTQLLLCCETRCIAEPSSERLASCIMKPVPTLIKNVHLPVEL